MHRHAPMRMPELLVYGRATLAGLLLAESARLALLSSAAFGNWLNSSLPPLAVCAVVVLCLAVPVIYGWKRQAFAQLRRMVASRRADLLVGASIGVWADFLVAPKLAKFHGAVVKQDMAWAPLVLSLLVVVLLASIFRHWIAQRSMEWGQVRFLSDDEIDHEQDDVLGIAQQAKEFADTVLAVGAQPGLVFGLDAPWGTGKTSFLNLAEREWAESEFIVVVKFQTLRYASEPDLSERFIRELCTAIKQQAFAPEFAPAADRYSRMLKGKADVSFLGFKLSLEPSNETIDELLEDIDAVLKQCKKRLIVIIEDLDRLEPKLVNNVLFTVRRTFRLSQAAYILCYDAEMLVVGKEEGARARDFLEKFITVKLSLFVDGEVLKKFLQTDWKQDAARFPLIPADNMFKLSGVMNTVAVMVAGKDSHRYAPLLGDLRKLKRLVNAMILMQLDKFDLGRSDFDPRDLVHLVLLHLRYPGVFRKIYVEETEGRTGMFSLKRADDNSTASLRNDDSFNEFVEKLDESAKFLVKQLFDLSTLSFSSYNQPNEGVLRSRACFNSSSSRNLENYLKLIVRFTAPTDVETFRLYKEEVDAFIAGRKTIKDILSSDKFSLQNGSHVQDEFWRVLVNTSHKLQPPQATEAIDQLVDALPTYSSIEDEGRGLRQRSIFTLVTLLDRAGYGAPQSGHIRDGINVREIAERILGEPGKFSPPLIERIADPKRGALGWNDLMLFRLVCSFDRTGSLGNVYRGLLQFEDPSATGAGEVSLLARNSLRRLSQSIFQLFKLRYIQANVNFYLAVDEISDGEVFGDVPSLKRNSEAETPEVVRSAIKSFVIYQLVNTLRGTGSGVGCGVYDEEGTEDQGGIRAAMVRYLLEFCFDPTVRLEHALVFGDFCVRSIRESATLLLGEPTASSIETTLTQILPKEDLAAFWLQHRDVLRSELLELDRQVVAHSFQASYKDKLPIVFSVLDSMTATVADADTGACSGQP